MNPDAFTGFSPAPAPLFDFRQYGQRSNSLPFYDDIYSGGLASPGGNSGMAFGLDPAGDRNLSLGLYSKYAQAMDANTPGPADNLPAPGLHKLSDMGTDGMTGGAFGVRDRPGLQTDLSQAPALSAALQDQGPGALENVASGVGIGSGLLSGAKALGFIGTAGKTAAGAGFLATAGAVVPIIGAAAGLIGLGVQWYYASKQRKAEEAQRKKDEQFRSEQVAEEKRRWELNRRMTERQIAEQERANLVAEGMGHRKMDLEEYATKEGITMKKAQIEEQNRINGINSAIQLLMGTMNLFNSEAGRQQDYNFWERRAATA